MAVVAGRGKLHRGHSGAQRGTAGHSGVQRGTAGHSECRTSGRPLGLEAGSREDLGGKEGSLAVVAGRGKLQRGHSGAQRGTAGVGLRADLWG